MTPTDQNDWSTTITVNARLTVFMVLLASLVAGSAHARQSDALRQQFLECKARAATGAPIYQCLLGDCYYNGRGVEKDYVEAANWYRKAAEQNFALAQGKLGVCYENGQGVDKNSVEAVRWFLEAAELNDPDAQFNLGIRFATGKGVDRNYEKAYAWLNLAAVISKDAAAAREALEKRMSPRQIAEAQKRTKELRTEIEARIKAGGK